MFAKKLRWQTYVVMSILLLGVIAAGNWHLFNRVGLHQGASSGGSTLSGGQAQADTAAPDQMISQLTSDLGDVSGVYDMVVLPDGLKDGQYLVSAMINGPSAPSAADTQALNADVDAFFKAVYSSQEPISMAEMTMTTDAGQIIGTAGLGKDAYQHLASSTMSSDLATALRQTTSVDDNTPKEAWYQLKSSSS